MSNQSFFHKHVQKGREWWTIGKERKRQMQKWVSIWSLRNRSLVKATQFCHVRPCLFVDRYEFFSSTTITTLVVFWLLVFFFCPLVSHSCPPLYLSPLFLQFSCFLFPIFPFLLFEVAEDDAIDIRFNDSISSVPSSIRLQ